MEIDAFDFDGTLIKEDSIKVFLNGYVILILNFFLYYIKFIFSYKNISKLKFKRVNFFYNLMIKRKKYFRV